ncbi:MAG: hypothetical protein WCD79_16455 [Chthoniobacteraceae bacterium]
MTTKTTKSEDSEALAKLVEASKTTRLTPEQETEAAGLVKASLLSGKAGIISAVGSMIGLPWIVGVNSIVETWPSLKAPSRKNLLAALAAQEGEQARRFRLSLGRGLFVADAEAGLKLVQGVCAEMATGENGMLTQNDRQIFANVLIGKDKPWLLRLPIAEEGAETDALIRCAVAATFSRQCPPLTQLFLLRWIAAASKLVKLPEDLLDLVAKSIKRWHPKLQDQFKTDIPEVPPMIEEALKKGPALQPKQQAPAQPKGERPESGEGEEPQERAEQRPERAERTERAEQPERPQSNARQERQERQERRQQRQLQPAPQQARQPAGGFDLVASLRQIETHVQSLRSELNEAKTELRNRKESPRGRDRDRRQSAPEIPNPNSNDIGELQRHNLQLEETITELRNQLQELATDHEDIATSMQAHEETPQADGKEQLKALLGIKLREHFTDFQKLAKEPADEVFREHYRLLLEDVFVILEKQGVVLKEG